MSDITNPTSRTRVVREPHRGVYDRATAYRILDEAILCHVGFVADGQPYVIPTSYGRDGDVLYIHGSAASRMLRNLDQGVPVCVTVTLARRVSARPLDLQSLHELPLGGDSWEGDAGR